MRARGLAILGAMLLVGSAATTAFAAAPPGTVTVESTGCSFTVLVNLDQAYDLIGWKIKQYDAVNWNDGTTLFKGSGPTDGNGDLTLGPFTAPEGHYNAIVDNEYPPDGSSIVTDFWLSCPASAPASSAPGGSEAPIESSAPPSVAPSTAPTGSELPAEGSAPPSGEVEGISGTGVTPPPTDAGPSASDPGAPSSFAVVALVLAATLAVGLLTSRRIPAVARFAPRRRH